jgi:hypothetical protein
MLSVIPEIGGMNVSIGERWEAFLRALFETLNASIAEGGHVTDDELTAMPDAKVAELSKGGT